MFRHNPVLNDAVVQAKWPLRTMTTLLKSNLRPSSLKARRQRQLYYSIIFSASRLRSLRQFCRTLVPPLDFAQSSNVIFLLRSTFADRPPATSAVFVSGEETGHDVAALN